MATDDLTVWTHLTSLRLQVTPLSVINQSGLKMRGTHIKKHKNGIETANIRRHCQRCHL